MGDKKEIKIIFCNGPTCKPLGNWEMQSRLLDYASKHDQIVLDLEEYHCFARCQELDPLCPSVQINGKWLIQADWQKVKVALDQLINHE
jgi:NADH:ubiquinone oxidoreductase subunit E